jgi:UTP--glucose-1-phosphate uridylyltransferase
MSKMPRPTKAVIPAAGFGTRFLPQTKAMPKEMLPLIDKPIIQYLVEELVEAGIKDIIIVTGYTKRGIEDHFDVPNRNLVTELENGGESKRHMLEEVEAIANLANFCYIRQKGKSGNARPIINAQHLVGNEPFFYAYPDDVFISKNNRFKMMMELFDELQAPIFPCLEVDSDDDYKRYGIVGGSPVRDGLLKMDAIVEKPGRAAAPSNMASLGAYLLTPDIFGYIDAAEAAAPADKEFMIQPIMLDMLREGKDMYAYAMQDTRYCDTGAKLDYLKSVVQFALLRNDLGEDFRNYLKGLEL